MDNVYQNQIQAFPLWRTDFIVQHRYLFWSVGDAHLPFISDELLIETIFNYGSLEDVKFLFDNIGIENVAKIFYKSLNNRTRHNYFPEVANFFHLYFKRHVSEDII